MNRSDTDPLSVIATDPPAFSPADAMQLLRREYGLTATVTALISERDQNFRVDSVDGRRYVLKFANASEDPLVTDFQIRALLHIEAQAVAGEHRIAVPRLIRTLDGRTECKALQGRLHSIVRLVTWVPGTPMGDGPHGERLCRNIGRCLAELGRLLREFSHAGENPSLLWDMKRSTELRRLLPLIESRPLREVVIRALDAFENSAVPVFASLRWQVIHNDLNPQNVLLDANHADRIVGVIDFGDMLRSPLIVDVAVAAAYLRCDAGSPLREVAALVAGYHECTPLSGEELDLLFYLIQARLAATVCIKYWRASERGADDEYLRNALSSEVSSEDFIVRLDSTSAEQAAHVFRRACGLA